MTDTGGDCIRRLILAASVMTLAFVATPRFSSAAFSLALARGDYPSGSQITGLPSTNQEVTTRLGPVHHSTFDRLHRIDGDGWIQGAIWHFTTGRGATRWQHRTVFLYAINLFHNQAQAARAVADEKIRAYPSKVSHLPSRIYHVSDVHGTLVFAFFAYREVEVETYYEYKGVAPTAIATLLRHTFSKQSSHLAALARRFSALVRRKPTATDLPSTVPLPTPTPMPTVNPTVTPSPTVAATTPPVPTNTATLLPSAVPTSTLVPIPSPTVTPISTGLIVRAVPQSPTYLPKDNATILVHATLNGQSPVGASVDISFFFPGDSTNCAAVIDASGSASCSVAVPSVQPGTPVQVNVQVVTTTNVVGTANTSFIVR